MQKTKIMGILNITPDSFFDKGSFFNFEAAIARANQMIAQGADILDIGGESSRPGALPVTEEEEIRRTIPIIEALSQSKDISIPIPISIDTTKPRVAFEALKAGASLINDITGFQDPAMREIAATSSAEICVMHMQGTPQTMQLNPNYPDGIVPYLLRWFEDRIELLVKSGVKEKNIILDPGVGFGKTIADNLQIIHNLPKFKELGFAILLGISRKSFMARILHKTAMELLPATLTMNTIAVINRVDYIRVHDIMEHRDLIELVNRMQGENQNN